MSGGTATTHRDAGPLRLLADRGGCEAQLRTDLPQGPTLAVQVGCTLTSTGATVASLSLIGLLCLSITRIPAGLLRRAGDVVSGEVGRLWPTTSPPAGSPTPFPSG